MLEKQMGSSHFIVCSHVVDLRFYTIQLDTNVYNDGYYYNTSSDTTTYVY